MRSYVTIIILSLVFFGNGLEAREVASSPKLAPISFISDNLPEEDRLEWGWSYASWSFPNRSVLTAEYQCVVEKFLEFWPSIKSCYGAFVSSVSGERSPYYLTSKSANYHEALFQDVVENGPYISFVGKEYELSRFDEVTSDAIKKFKGAVQYKIQKERGVVFLVAALIFLSTWYSVVFVRKMVPVVKSRLAGVDKKIIDIPRKVKGMHDQHIFRSAVIDESARELTRKNFKDADERSQMAIQKAIIQALENGDRELAEALKSTLKK